MLYCDVLTFITLKEAVAAASSGAAAAAAAGGGRNKLAKIIAEVRLKLPDADECVSFTFMFIFSFKLLNL